MPRLRFLRPSTGLGLEKRGIHPPIWPFIGRFYYLRLFAWLLLALISASLISTLKAPDSFALHGDIILEVYPQFENSVYDDPEVYTDTGTITFMYIPYGAENGYGGMSVGTALYRNNEQRFSDIEDLGGGLQGAINEYQYALFESFKAEAEIEEANGNISITRVIVNADKILKHLKD